MWEQLLIGVNSKYRVCVFLFLFFCVFGGGGSLISVSLISVTLIGRAGLYIHIYQSEGFPERDIWSLGVMLSEDLPGWM